MIDSHVHLVDPARFPFPSPSTGYVPGLGELATVEDLLAVMARHGVARAVLVAASVYGADNRCMLAAAEAHPDRFRIVAGIDPADPGSVTAAASGAGVVGVRLNVTDDRAFRGVVGGADALLDAIAAAGLVACIQAPPAVALRLLDGHDGLQVALDHLGRPDLEGGLPALAALGQRPGTWLKLSGAFRIGGERDWRTPGAAIRAAVEAFAPDRLLWGSDWPFLNVAPRPDYADCLAWARRLTGADLAGNAERLFWLAT